MRFVHFSDLHLDTAFVWAPPLAARQRRQALRDTLLNILALADRVEADAVLCAGDLYEHERFTADTAAFLADAFGDLHRPVFIAPGNHDWLGPASLYRQVQWPDHVHVFAEDRLRPVTLTDGLTLWGAAHCAPANTDGFLDGGFRVERGGVHLALFHGSERGALVSEGSGKHPHAPFDAAQIPAAGLDHALVGHYHRPRADPYHTYPGNPDPLTFGEDGIRGAVVVDVGGRGEIARQWHTVAETTVHDLDLDVTGCSSLQDVRGRAAERLRDVEGVVRLTLHGELAPDIDLHPGSDFSLRSLEIAGVEALQVRTGRLRPAYDLDAVGREETVRGAFVRDVLAADLEEDERRRVLTVGLRALEGRDDFEVD